MTILSSYSSNIGDEHNFSVQAQVLEGSQQPQQAPSSLTTSPQAGMMPTIKITSHSSGQQVKTGPLTISGTSSDTHLTDCEVYADWNDNMPFRKAVAAGPGGDYSKWTFTYDSDYHLIRNGTNNLTSKISCVDGPANLTKWNSVNLIGVNGSDTGAVISQAITSGPTPTPTPTVGLPLPTPNQAELTSSPLDRTIGEVDQENEEGDDEEEGNDSEDSNSDDNDEEDNDEEDNDEEDNDEEDNDEEDNDEEDNSSENEDSGDNRDEENGDDDEDDNDGGGGLFD